MNKLIEFGWILSSNNFEYINKLRRCMFLMRLFKPLEIENFTYTLIDKYFIDNSSNLYFIGNNEVYSININEDFNYLKDSIDSCLEDYKKIKFICKYSIDNIYTYELISIDLKREKRINEITSK
jgi:hypothetical protein